MFRRRERSWRSKCTTMVDHFPIGDVSLVLSLRSFLPSVRRGRNLGSERDKRWPWPMEIVFLVFSAGPTNLLGAGNKPRLNGINAWHSLVHSPNFRYSSHLAFETEETDRTIRTSLSSYHLFPSNGWKQNYYISLRDRRRGEFGTR